MLVAQGGWKRVSTFPATKKNMRGDVASRSRRVAATEADRLSQRANLIGVQGLRFICCG
jgi:hypothetical protein